MEEKKEVEKKKTKKSQGLKITKNQILAFIAYIGIGCIAIALLLVLIFKSNTRLSSAFSAVGEVIAYCLSIVLAFFWVKSHKQIGWIVCYVIFVVTIVVLYILKF